MIVDGGTRMRSILDSTLELSRAGTHDMVFKDVDLKEVVDELQQVLEEDLRGVELVVNLRAPVVASDRWAVFLVLKNLLTNAIKYRSPKRPPIIFLKSYVSGDTVRVAVQDNGVGIRDDLQHKVWLPFKRFAHRHDVPGNGVGLTIVKRLLHRVHGDVELQSEVDEGSTFTVTFPLKAPSA